MPKIGDTLYNLQRRGTFYKFTLDGKGHLHFKLVWSNHLYSLSYLEGIGKSRSNFSVNDLLGYMQFESNRTGLPITRLCTAKEYHELESFLLSSEFAAFYYNNINTNTPAHHYSQIMAIADEAIQVLVMEGEDAYIYDAAGNQSFTAIDKDENISELFIISFPVGEHTYPAPNIQDSEGDAPPLVFGRTKEGNHLWQSTIDFTETILEVKTPSVEEKEYIMHLHSGWDIYSLPFDITTLTKVEHLTKNTDGSFTVDNVSTNLTSVSFTEYGETYDTFTWLDILSYAVSNDEVIIVKDWLGDAVVPEFNYDGIGGISKHQGYQIKMAANTDRYLRFTAKPHYREVGENNEIEYYVEFNIPLGWSLIAWPWEESADLEHVLADYVNDIVILKDGDGNPFMPQYNYNGIGQVESFHGYNVKTSKALTLKIPRPL